MGKKKKKNRNLGPRAKRMKRMGRLQSAKSWIPKYEGSNIVKGYRKHFGVNYLCAIRELEMLGIKIDPEYIAKLKQTINSNAQANLRKKTEKQELEYSTLYGWNENFSFIAGYTEGGAAFGTPWESEHLLID